MTWQWIVACAIIWTFTWFVLGYKVGKLQAYSLTLHELPEHEDKIWKALFGRN
jgi:hypothetical protein